MTAGLAPLAAVAAGWQWYVDGPLTVVVAAVAGYAAGAWLPRRSAAVGVAAATVLLVAASQAHDDSYHWVDDLVFFLVVVGGPAAAGAAVTMRSRQLGHLTRLQAQLEDLQRVEVTAARLEEQSRVLSEVHARLAEQIAGIAIRAQGALRGADTTAFAAIETEARSVLDRLREALGSMRADDRPSTPDAAAEPSAPRLTVLDLAVPAAVGAAMAVETAVISDARGPLWANVVAALVVAAPLVARRRHPIAATAASSALGMAMSAALTPIPETVTGVALLAVIFYSIGAWCRPWWWLAGGAVAALGTVGMGWVSRAASEPSVSGDQWIVLAWGVAALAVGRITAGWQDRVRRTGALVDALERGRTAAVRLAVAQEREVLASELHDTVAHAMTVVCLQAGAHQRAGGDRDDALRVITSVAEGSLVELRDGLEAMESADNPLDPSRIAALGRRVGVDLRVSAEGGESGPAAALAHRVIREAVVNVARHAPGASAAVRVHRSGDELTVEVVDEGSPEAAVLHGAGSGLRGLAETLESIGGRLEWGQREPTGFRVAALIPQVQR
jgi:signal transduction histidine kinase